ncbi:MAG: spore maturation protein A [Clostridia bacterium]|nr:spore maturation protein A [Clostridia bacterium]
MLQIIFGVLMGASLLYGMIRGQGEAVAGAMLSAAGEGVKTALSMAGGFAFFCGMIGILRRAGAMEWLAGKAAPMLKILMGRDVPSDALEYVAGNLCANLLGMGNAATPLGMEAARRLARGEQAGNALCLFLVMNAASIEILPTSVISLRAAAGSANPGAITLPTLLVTVLSAFFGILSCKIMEKKAC